MILSVLSPTENQSRDLFEKSKIRCLTSPHVMHVHLTWIINPNELYYITQLLFIFLLLHWEWNKNWKVADWNLTEQQWQNKKESFLCKNNWSLSEIELIIKALITMIMISNNNKKNQLNVVIIVHVALGPVVHHSGPKSKWRCFSDSRLQWPNSHFFTTLISRSKLNILFCPKLLLIKQT